MIARGRLHAAVRVGGFAALGSLLTTVLRGRATDRVDMLIGAVTVWAIVTVLWLLVEMLSARRG
ncbi:hypothetical protein [Sphingomonas nostoxanthinifaciens]|uniref:hypothetical protein n=1 Tax=Sphingomonas nostoxanthinifaciens TaxID=2872652 RepID=UPI001CC1D995|nr:hypothetical protein [Sphingomonas nostoxanthinifaciens]UAK23355.1 hypothetical protein K8P63_13230 [Sphingomonas nostoxanthinifaciens]